MDNRVVQNEGFVHVGGTHDDASIACQRKFARKERMKWGKRFNEIKHLLISGMILNLYTDKNIQLLQ